MDPEGNSTVLWQEQAGSFTNLLAARSAALRPPAEAVWQTSKLVSDGQHSCTNQKLAAGGDGTLIAVWEQAPIPSEETSRIYAATGSINGDWSERQPLSEDGAATTLPSVAVDATGNATATWLRHSDNRDDVWVARYIKGQGWQQAKMLSDGKFDCSQPTVAFDDLGRGLLIWTEANQGIMGGHFE
jgi:hypothetical protein